MKHTKQKILVIVGPTASGKSDVAVMLAKQFDGEIISADSRQVYRGLDIGSGKITKREMKGVLHHLLDVADPKKIFSVADFQRLGKKAIADIVTRGKLPIIAGGTGFYIDALVHNMKLAGVPENKTLRRELEKKSVEELFTMLQDRDPERAEVIDSNNKVRLIRALEIVDALGSVPKTEMQSPYDALWIGLDWPKEVLAKRIKERLHARMRRGMLAEVKRLHAKGISYARMEALGLEYRYLARFLTGVITKEAMLDELVIKIRQYAKRQRTWFKRNKNIQWFAPTDIEQIKQVSDTFLKS